MTNEAIGLTPLQVVEKYLNVLYNEQRLDLLEELIDPETWRHYPGRLDTLTLAESAGRIATTLSKYASVRFVNSRTVVEGEMVTSIWNGWMTKADGRVIEVAGIEVFRVRNGRIIDVWNQDPPGSKGLWPDTRS